LDGAGRRHKSVGFKTQPALKLPSDSDHQQDFGFRFHVETTFLSRLSLKVNQALGFRSVLLGVLLGS